MKSKFIKFFVVAGFFAATVTSCYKDDFNDLQKQVDELKEKVAANAESIQDQIKAIAALQQQDADFSQEIQDIVSDLEQVSDDVESSANTVFYGNLVTDEDFAAYEAQGADVVTGKVVISTPEQAAIVNNCRWVGQDLITKVGSIEGIQNVGGDLIIEPTDTTTVINIAGLLSVAGNFEIPQSETLQSVTLNDLVVLTGKLSLNEGNAVLTALSMESLEIVGSVYLNNDSGIVGGVGGPLNDINLNGANVAQNVTLQFIGTSSSAELSLGEVGGDIVIEKCGIGTINFSASKLYGNVTISNNSTKEINFASVTDLTGDLIVLNNSVSSGGGGPVYAAQGEIVGLETLDFGSLSTIGGDVIIEKNNLLADVLNNVQTVHGDITFNIDNKELIVIAFEKLTTVEMGSILLKGDMYKFTGFNMLSSIKIGKSISLGETYLYADNTKRGYYSFIVVSGDSEAFNAFNSLERMEGSLTISTNYFGRYTENGYVDMASSFKKLSYIKNFYVYQFQKYGSDLFNAFPAVTVIDNFYVKGEEKYSYSEKKMIKVECNADFSNSFASLETITTSFNTVGGLWNVVEGLNVKNVGKLSLGKMKVLTMPELTALTYRYGNILNVYETGLNLSAPKLESIAYKLMITPNEEGGDITLDMPLLSNVPEVYINFAYKTVNSFTAELPKLTELNKLTVSYKKGTLDATHLLTGLTTVNTFAKLYYKSGQGFCGLSTFLKGLTYPSSVLYLYKDNKLVSDDEEEAEVATLLAGC